MEYTKIASRIAPTGRFIWLSELRPEFISKIYGYDSEDETINNIDAPNVIPAGSCFWWAYLTPPGGFVMQSCAAR